MEIDARAIDERIVRANEYRHRFLEGREDLVLIARTDLLAQLGGIELRRDGSVKAIVLRVNSPGGSALASEVMWQAVHAAAQDKSRPRGLRECEQTTAPRVIHGHPGRRSQRTARHAFIARHHEHRQPHATPAQRQGRNPAYSPL